MPDQIRVTSHHASGFESPDKDPLVCDLCKVKLDSREEFKEHLQTKHNIPVGPG